jgi:hypothetical protein
MRRSPITAVVLLGLVWTGLVAAAPAASAASTTCLVVDTNTNTSYRSLPDAVNAAAAGDTLFVKGTCTGDTTYMFKDLTLTGQSSGGNKTATLDGGSPTLFIGPDYTVTLNMLVLTKGDGGIFNNGTVIMNGSTITGNTNTSRAGIYNNGTATLNNSTITGNTTTFDPGGIFNNGLLTLNSSTISGNTSFAFFGFGGGIYNNGTVIMNGLSAIIGNNASQDGGGVYNNNTVIMNGSSIITGNTAARGGGIFNGCSGTLGGAAAGNVYGNKLDDIFAYPRPC